MQSRPDRFEALDGLRGLAAVAVLFGHILMTVPHFADASHGDRSQSGWSWAMTWTPLHLFWEGTGAVIVFFVLSGFVLGLPLASAMGTRPTWRAYYPSRMLRLYVPVWGAVAATAALVVLVPREARPGMSWWTAEHDQDYGTADWLGSALLTSTGWENSALWSLQYEVAFSLLLPLYFLLGRYAATPTIGMVGVVALVAATGIGVVLNIGWLIYLPMFGCGILMARHAAWLRDLRRRAPEWSLWVALSVAVLGLTNMWLPGPLSLPGTPGMLAGAVLLVWLFLVWEPARRIGEARLVQWLGAVSFSLYLVHEPLVVSVAIGWPDAPWQLRGVLSVVASLILAWAFMKVCERPAHLVARAVRRWLAGREVVVSSHDASSAGQTEPRRVRDLPR